MLRGANKQEIFHDDEDRLNFLRTVERYKGISGIYIYAWCLMSNHVHLLLKEGEEEISVTMKRIGVSFVQGYNFKYMTTGHLFQDRFKSENVEERSYLLTVIRYIHQNPVKAGMVNRVNEWRWSSCHEYYGGTTHHPMKLLDSQSVFELFSSDKQVAVERFKEFNERKNTDVGLDEEVTRSSRLSDEEARPIIKRVLGQVEIAKVKSLPRVQRNEHLRRVKRIEGLSHRQVARIFGVSPSLVFKA